MSVRLIQRDEGSLPVYRQISQMLRQEIQNFYEAGDALPTEAELAAEGVDPTKDLKKDHHCRISLRLMGESGSGKSTAVKCLYFERETSSGSATFYDHGRATICSS